MHEQRDAFAKRNGNNTHIARFAARAADLDTYIACDRNGHDQHAARNNNHRYVCRRKCHWLFWVQPLLWKLSAQQNLSLIHISEPTRRTPISYAVFCLKKKKKNKI